MKLDKSYLIGLGIGVIILIIGIVFLLRGDNISYFILVLSLIIIVAPFFTSFLIERNREKQLEDKFLEFVRDLVENVKSGTPISKGIINLKNRDYGALTSYVSKLANQIYLGIPLTQALFTFAKDTQSEVILRAVSLISEAERAGGKIDTILESVAKSVNQIDELKKERRSAIYNLIVQGYIIFIVFIVIMLVLQYKILPLTSALGGSTDSLTVSMKTFSPGQFSMPILILLIVQSIFAGLVIGKISEGSVKDGIKHSVILLALTLLIKTGATALLG